MYLPQLSLIQHLPEVISACAYDRASYIDCRRRYNTVIKLKKAQKALRLHDVVEIK